MWDEIMLRCNKCEGWVVVEAKDVTVCLNLKIDRYEFTAFCPNCGAAIYNSRLAFR